LQACHLGKEWDGQARQSGGAKRRRGVDDQYEVLAGIGARLPRSQVVRNSTVREVQSMTWSPAPQPGHVTKLWGLAMHPIFPT
jgi:hypothetical protein